MPTNIESFVKTLESEGVDAGKRAAEKIEADARGQAEMIVAEGQAEADRIIEEAKAEARKVQARMNSSLELAARDAVYMLREKLSQQLKTLLSWNVEKTLNEEETLAKILREAIPVYTMAYADNKLTTEINVPKDLKSRLLESVIRELINSLRSKNIQIDVKHNLAKSGFEYKIEGSTVEVSTESVTALLTEMIDPELQQFLEKAANVENQTA